MFKCNNCDSEFKTKYQYYGHISKHSVKHKKFINKKGITPNLFCKNCGKPLVLGKDKRKKFCNHSC